MKQMLCLIAILIALGACTVVAPTGELRREPYVPVESTEDSELGYLTYTFSEPESLYYNAEMKKPEYFARRIFRVFEPNVKATIEDVQHALQEFINTPSNNAFEDDIVLGDVICPLLYSESLITCSDETLKELFEENGFFCTVNTEQKDGLSVRVIGLGQKKADDVYSEIGFFDRRHYTFLQTWTDQYIWVQPVSESRGHFEGRTAVLSKDDTGNQYLILVGEYEYGRGGYSTHGYSFQFDGSFWHPCNLEDVSGVKTVLDYYSDYAKVKLYIEGFSVTIS